MFIPRDYPNDDAENRVRQKPCNDGEDNPPPSPRMPSAPTLPQVPYVPQVQQMPHGSDTRRSMKKPLLLAYSSPEGTYATAGDVQTDQTSKL